LRKAKEMSASEQPNNEAQREPEEGEARGHIKQPPGGVQELPLFLRDISDGRKGNAQDEKDEMGE
jgi:hypothetical protein